MAVTLNANATADTHNDPVTTLDNANLTIAAGSNIGLIAQIGIDGGTPTITSVTWDQGGTNQAMTLITSSLNGTLSRSYLYGLVNPTVGNKTLRVVISAGSEVFLNATAFNGVDQTGGSTSFVPATPTSGSSGTPSITIPSAAGNMTIDCVMAPDLLQTPTQTQNFAQNGGAGSSAASSRANGAANVTHSWASVGVAWASCGCNIVAAAGAGSASASTSPSPSASVSASPSSTASASPSATPSASVSASSSPTASPSSSTSASASPSAAQLLVMQRTVIDYVD